MEDHFEQIEITTALPALRITMQLPNQYIEENLVNLRRLVTFFVIIMGIAVIVLITVCTMSAARPLNRLTKQLTSSRHLKNEDAEEPETLCALVQRVASLDQRMDGYEDIIAQQKERLRMQVLERALYRGIYNEKDCESFRTAFPKFPKIWRMAYLQFAAEEQNVDTALLLPLFTVFLQKQLSRAILLPIESDTVVLILSCMAGEEPEKALESLRVEAQDSYALDFDFLISTQHADPRELAVAYQQLEYAAAEMDSTVAPVHFPLSLQQLQTIYRALTSGDEAVSVGMLNDCTQELLESGDYVLAKHTFRMISNMLVMIKLESRCNLSDVTIPMFQQDIIDDLFNRQLPQCFSMICERVSQQKKTAGRSLEDHVLRYIQEHIANQDLCISMVTEAFHISAPTLQKRLHAAVGMTFSAYVENQRMTSARSMLRETTKSVQEIAEACGYANVNSFYKAYKRRFHEPPLAARK